MSAATELVERLSRRDPTLTWIELYYEKLTDSELGGLADCLMAHPDVVTHVHLGSNKLTDETGVKLGLYLASSSTIELLDLSHNQFGEETYLTIAAALRVNSSLQCLSLSGNKVVDEARVDKSFVEALRLNSDRPVESEWYLYSTTWDFVDYTRLKDVTDNSTPPSMLEIILCTHLK